MNQCPRCKQHHDGDQCHQCKTVIWPLLHGGQAVSNGRAIAGLAILKKSKGKLAMFDFMKQFKTQSPQMYNLLHYRGAWR